MRIQVLSDLHLEFGWFSPVSTSADVVVLAGDIDIDTVGIEWARRKFPKQEIVYVHGNHELYGGHWTETLEDLRDEAKLQGVHFLENDEAVIGNVRFLGACMWTDFDFFGTALRERSMDACKSYLADFHRIRMDPGSHDDDESEAEAAVREDLVSPRAMRKRHLESRAWLEQKLLEPVDIETVVVTHHCPSAHSVPDRYRQMLGNAGFTSHLDDLMRHPKVWVHGHTHDGYDYVHPNGARVACNPRGYSSRHGSGHENGSFDPGLTIEV